MTKLEPSFLGAIQCRPVSCDRAFNGLTIVAQQATLAVSSCDVLCYAMLCCALLQRVVLFSADPSTGLISLRHFTISTAPSGVKKPLKALVLRQAVPDMGELQDVADLITKSGYGSVSTP